MVVELEMARRAAPNALAVAVAATVGIGIGPETVGVGVVTGGLAVAVVGRVTVVVIVIAALTVATAGVEVAVGAAVAVIAVAATVAVAVAVGGARSLARTLAGTSVTAPAANMEFGVPGMVIIPLLVTLTLAARRRPAAVCCDCNSCRPPRHAAT